MRIEISQKSDGTFLADCSDLPGSPPIGSGETKDQALGCLIRRMSREIEGMSGLSWMQKYFGFDISFTESKEPESHEEIHDDLWDNDVSYAIGYCEDVCG